MSLIERKPRAARILLALDAASHRPGCVESAVALAVHLEAELRGLFVEDDDLLRSAELPFAREVIGGSGRERHLGGGQLARSLRAQARQAEERLAEVAARSQVKWSFRIVRGRLLPAILAETESSCLFTMGRSRCPPWYGHTRPWNETAGQTIYLVYDKRPTGRRALAVASKLAANGHPHLVLLVSNPLEIEIGSPRQADLKRLREHGLQPRLRQLAGGRIEELANILRREPPMLLVLPAAERLLEETTSVERILDQVDCPVILVR